MNLSRPWLFLLLAAVAALPVSARAATPAELQATLRARWLNHAFILRGFPSDSDYAVDAQGNSLRALHRGPWTLARGVVSEVKVNDRRIEIRLGRQAAIFDAKQDRFAFQAIPHAEPIDITVRAAPQGWDGLDPASLERRLFVLDYAELSQLVPEPWQPVLRGIYQDVAAPFPLATNFQEASPPMTPPQALKTPDPAYSAAAQSLGLAGSIQLSGQLGVDGKISHVVIITPLGAGLEEQAIAAFEAWKFQPATQAGAPVPVTIDVEVNFQMRPPL